MANPINTRTTTPPPTAEPNKAPVVICGAAAGGKMPAKGFGEDVLVGPGVSVGVTDGKALIRREDEEVGVFV